MIGRYMLVGFTHLVSVALILKILNFALPCYLTCHYTCAANFIMFLIVAKLSFGFTRRKFLNDRIQPENRAVLITGCDSGFGNGLARLLDSRGFHVFASCYNPAGAGAQQLKKECSKRLQIFGLDVTKDESVQQAVEFVKENLGTSELWAVVNNAGIHKGFSVELTPIEEFKEVMEVNAFGPVRVTKAFLPLLRQSRGRVVNVTSIAGRIAYPHFGPYVMSKFATVGFTETLRREMDVWGVRVITIEPEFFQTPISDPQAMAHAVDRTFAKIENDVRTDYGEKYLQNFKVFFEYNTSISSPKIQKVLNSLELAISLEQPDTVYRPSRNIFTRSIFSLYMLLPDILQDIVPGIYLHWLGGLPKPKEADNNL